MTSKRCGNERNKPWYSAISTNETASRLPGLPSFRRRWILGKCAVCSARLVGRDTNGWVIVIVVIIIRSLQQLALGIISSIFIHIIIVSIMFGSRCWTSGRSRAAAGWGPTAGAAVVSASSWLAGSTAEPAAARQCTRAASSAISSRWAVSTTTTTTTTATTFQPFTTMKMMMQQQQQRLYTRSRLYQRNNNNHHAGSISWPRMRQFYTTTSSPATTTTTMMHAQPRSLVVSGSTLSSRSRPQTSFVSTKTTTTAAPNNNNNNNNNNNSSFLAWYEQQLHTLPVVTKMVTGGILWSVGDAVAQLVPAGAAAHAYDWPRTGRAALFGFALHAPTSHGT